MKNFLLAVSFVSLATAAHSSPRVFLQNVPDRNRENTPHGYAVAQRANGKWVRLSHSARCWDLKKSPDGRSWAWTEGATFKRRETAQTIFPAHIVAWRNGKSARIQTEKIYNVAWRWNSSSQIAAISVGAHGPPYWQLFDARSGRQLERFASPTAGVPNWARQLPVL